MKRGADDKVCEPVGKKPCIEVARPAEVTLRLIRPSEVPEYLRKSEFYQSLNTEDDEEFHISADLMKKDLTVKSLKDASSLLNTIRFWGLDIFPMSIVSYALAQPFSQVEAALSAFATEFPVVQTMLCIRNEQNSLQERMEVAMESGILRLVMYLNEKGTENVYTQKALELAAGRGHLGCLRFALHQESKLRQQSDRNMDVYAGAVANGHLACVTLLHASYIPVHGYTDFPRYVYPWGSDSLASVAIAHDQRECLQFMSEHYRCVPWRAESEAAASGSLRCLQYILERCWHRAREVSVCIAAAENGHQQCLKYLHEKGYPLIDTKRPFLICHVAALHGHLNCLQYAVEHGCPLMLAAATVKVNKQYKRRFHVTQGPVHLVELAAMREHWGCVLYLILQGCPLTRGLTIHLARKHKKDLLRLAVERRCEVATEVGERYAKAGDLQGLM